MSHLTVAACQSLLRHATGDELAALLPQFAEDPRDGVRRACEAAIAREARRTRETLRLDSLATLEIELTESGYCAIAGVDEVGRGALAGPVTAAAVVLGPRTRIPGLDDSKRVPRSIRPRLAQEIVAVCVSSAVAHVPAHIVDAIGIAPATRWAMELALARLEPCPDHVISDGLRVGLPYPETPVVGGDARVASVAAASIVAKVARDALMVDLAMFYDRWNLEGNRGYGTPDHLAAIQEYGTSPIHRRTFSPCQTTPTLF